MHCKLHKKSNALSKTYYQYIKSTMLFAVEKIHFKTPPSSFLPSFKQCVF